MVGGEHAKVAGHQRRQQFGDARVETLEPSRIAGHIAAMAEVCVEIDVIGEQEAAVRKGFQRRDCHGEMLHVVAALHLGAGVAMTENVANLADADNGAPGLRRAIEDRAIGRWQREILAILRAFVSVGRRSHEWPRDDAPDVQAITQAPRDAADLVKALASKTVFMRGDLQHGIDGGVDDGLATAHMFVAQFLDDGDAGRMAVADHARQARLAHEICDQSFRNGRRRIGKITPGEIRRRTGYFPMS